jgi:hypothetical protein
VPTCGLLIWTSALLLNFTCSLATVQVTFKAFVDFCAITSMSADGSVAVGALTTATLRQLSELASASSL